MSTVTLRGESTVVRGVLSDGTAHGYELSCNRRDESAAAALVGRRLTDGSWGQTVVDGQLQTCRGEGFRQTLSFVAPEEAAAKLDPTFSL